MADGDTSTPTKKKPKYICQVAPGERNCVAAKWWPGFVNFVALKNRVFVPDPDDPDKNPPTLTDLGSLEKALNFNSGAPDPTLQGYVNDWVTKAPTKALFEKKAFAILDLTRKDAKKDPRKDPPRYAGYRATEMFFPASMGKLMVMLGAYQLKTDLQALAKDESITSSSVLFDRAAGLWDDLQVVPKDEALKTVNLRPKNPPIDLVNDHVLLFDGKPYPMGKFGAINFEKVFDPSDFDASGGKKPLKFKSDDLGFHQLYYIEYEKYRNDLAKKDKKYRKPEGIGLKTIDVSKLSFLDQMKLMIGFSNNDAPRYLLSGIGMVPVHSALWQSELFHKDRGGLWLGNTYQKKNVWHRPPFPSSSSTIAGSALALVTLMAAIFRYQIADKASCDEMQFMLEKGPLYLELWTDPPSWRDKPPGVGTKSFFGTEGLNAEGNYPPDGSRPRRDAIVHSKLGISPTGTLYDTAHVRRTVKGKKLEYVVSVLQVPDDDNADPFFDKFANAVDDAIQVINGVKPPG
jgi:hypothetical protein